MKNFLSTFLIMLCACFTTILFAQTQSFVIPTYYNANCQQVAGTWQGFFTDPSDLFGDGGPWPIKLYLYSHFGKIIGRIDASQAPDFVASNMKKKFWAVCENGRLKDIFMGNRGDCGSFSKGGELVSQNMLLLYLSMENAMNGTNFLVVLQRANNKFPYPIPKNRKDYDLDTPKSCHS